MHNNSQTIKPRVFVSSVLEGFKEYREVARQSIINIGGEPILVNEDFPSLISSSRNVCLDAVDSADALVVIVGERGGWKTPSGRLVIEEEYDRARYKKLPILVFIQDIKREPEAQRFTNEISDYIDGLFRVTFRSPVELKAEIEKALKSLFPVLKVKAMDDHLLIQFLKNPYSVANEASVRFIIAPERDEEVIDPVVLGSEDFVETILELGHSKKVRIFDYLRPKKHWIDGQSLFIHQFDPSGLRKETVNEVRLEILESGLMIIDSNVTCRVIRGQLHSLLDSCVVAEEDIRAVLNTCFQFTGALFDSIDQFKRHNRFMYNAALVNIGTRVLVKEPKEQNSYSLNMPGHNQPIIAFDSPRLLIRSDLMLPKNEIERAIVIFSRKI
ncbi:MAG: DUF4062 domain-containing protein [Candidatus Pacebacteria bacterium]|nr:DUF4062 domain-containing protein [Candidatus Paceibacterota bacterium]